MAGHSAVATRRKKIEEQVRIAEDLGKRAREVVDAINRRAYEIFEDQGRPSGSALAHWLQAESEILCPLHLDVEDLENALVVKGGLHGFSPDEFELKVEPRLLTIAGKQEQSQGSEDKKTPSNSHHPRRIFQTLVLPVRVQCEYAAALLTGDILEVILPKMPESSGAASDAA